MRVPNLDPYRSASIWLFKIRIHIGKEDSDTDSKSHEIVQKIMDTFLHLPVTDRKDKDEDQDLYIYSDLHGSKKTAGSGSRSDLLRIFLKFTLLPSLRDKGA